MAYGYDPSNPNTALINGQYYVWQPSTAGADAQAYLGANADPALVNQDTSPESGNGQWVPGTYDNPNGSFLKLLAEMVGGTSLGEYGLYSILGNGATAAASTAAGSSAPASAAVGSLPVTSYVGGAGTTVPLTAAGGAGSTIPPPGGSRNKQPPTPPPGGKITIPSWVNDAIATAAPTIGKLVGGGSSDLTNSLESALTSLVPDLKSSYELGIQRQQQASPLYDAVLKMALGRLPNWSTDGIELNAPSRNEVA
jgi:hypothetical protein